MKGKIKNKIHTSVVLTAIGCLTLLEIIALYKGIDGTLFSIIIAAIAGLAGLVIPTPKFLQQKQSVT